MKVCRKRWNFGVFIEGNERKELRFIERLLYISFYGKCFIYIIVFIFDNRRYIYIEKG